VSGAAGAGDGAATGSTTASTTDTRARGGLFHAAIRDPAVSSTRESGIRALFDAVDLNKDGGVDIREMRVYLERVASGADTDSLSQRFAACFLEGGSLDAAFAK
jgi:hypothetical protein